MAGFVKIFAFTLTGIFVISFALIFITGLGQKKGYKFFVGELSMLTALGYGLMVDPNSGFLDLPFVLPFIGCLILFGIASVLFGKAAFAQQGRNRYESGPP